MFVSSNTDTQCVQHANHQFERMEETCQGMPDKSKPRQTCVSKTFNERCTAACGCLCKYSRSVQCIVFAIASELQLVSYYSNKASSQLKPRCLLCRLVLQSSMQHSPQCSCKVRRCKDQRKYLSFGTCT